MIRIEELDYSKMKGKSYSTKIYSDSYLSIEPKDEVFLFEWKKSDDELVMPFHDQILSDWLDNPVAYGAYDGDELLGFVEGFLEKWNNRFRISNICVFDVKNRKTGIGQMLLDRITVDAKTSGARMIVLETQSFNEKAILFIKIMDLRLLALIVMLILIMDQKKRTCE